MSEESIPEAPTGAWNKRKVAAFRKAFMNFLNNVKIDSKETGGGTILGKVAYDAQFRFLDCVFSGLSDDIHDFKILKSRQLGISTMSEALDVFWLGMHAGLKGALVFDSTAHMEAARARIVDMINELPRSLKFPTIKSNNRYGLTLSNRSSLLFMAAGTRSSRSGGSLGASVGLNFLHCSEMCSWDNDEGIASLKAAMAKEFPNRLFIFESTARGFNAWHDMWEEAKQNDLSERTCFIGWWAKGTQRIYRGTPMFERYGTEPPSETEIDRMIEVKDRYGCEIDQEQLAWYRHQSNPSLETDADGQLSFEPDEYTAQNQPWTEDEAFQQTGSSFFSGPRLTEMSRTAATDKFTAYNYTMPTEFAYLSVDPTRNYRSCHLKVWKDPEPGGAYILAADPAFGHSEDNDRSSIQVLQCYADQIEQVAEFAYAGVRTDQFAWICASLLGWYSKSDNSSCRFILEINGPGEAVWNEYKSLKQRLSQGDLKYLKAKEGVGDIFRNARNYIYVRSDSMSASGGAWHWKTTPGNKVGLMERCRDFVSNGTVIIHSHDLITEMRGITREGDSIGATGRNKDDRVLALAIGIRAWEDKERKGLISAGRTREIEDKKRTMSIRDQWSMLSSYQLKGFMDRGAKAKAARDRAEAQARWRR